MHANEEEWGVHHEEPQRTVWIEGQGYVTPTRPADTTRQEALIRALTEEQSAAVTHPPERSVLVRAGAGTGKTRVLTHRIAWLIAGGVEPRRILAVTFTRKAAREMRERVDGLIGERNEGRGRGCQIGTYHGLSARLLRRVAGATARLTGRRLDDGFSILSDTGQIDAMKQAATQVIGPHNEIEADEAKRDGNAVPKPRKIARRSVKDLLEAMDLWTRDAPTLNALVDELRTQEMTVSFDRGQKIDAIDRPAADVLDAYIEWKNDNNCVDYADLIGLTVLTMEEEPELAGNVEQVLADEFQDTDVLQERWLKAVMSAHTAPLFAVGDANQLIYQWRGADPSQITTLPQRWNTDALNLTVNFRSPPKVLGLANATLAKNEVRVKTQWLRPCEARANEQDAVVRLRRFLNSREEAAWICDQIQSSISKGA